MMTLAIAAAGCFALAGPYITASDLANAVPGFVPANPAASIAYSPMPGVRRLFHPGEIQEALGRLGFSGAAPLNDVCFERSTAPLSADAVMQAMHRTLGPDAHIEIVEVSGFPAPPGEIVFPLQELGTPPIAVWRGYVSYDGDKKFRIWARVKVSVQRTRLVAIEQLQPGVPIRASQLSLEKIEEFPQRRVTPSSIEKAVGCLPHRFISPQEPVWTDLIDPPNDIAKGDRTIIVVNSGRARLSFDAEAQASGRRGDLISFRNPDSGKLFRARVDAPGKAIVDTPSLKP